MTAHNPPPAKSQVIGDIVGIDPGLSGALFFMDPRHPSTGEAVDIPTHQLVRGGKNKREIDIQSLLGLLQPLPSHAIVEAVGPMPRQGVSSVFAFGKTFGIILGVLAACEIPITLVPAAKWKKALGVPKAKDGARARASQLLPAAADQWPLVKHDGRAEAALIALFGLREMTSFRAMQPAREQPETQPRAAHGLLLSKR